MGARLGGLAVVVVILALGVFLGSAISQRWDVPEATAGAAPAGKRASERIRVEVLNGSGQSGLARSATEVLRGQGFDVVYFGNASESDHDSSVVLDRGGRVDFARDVADALRIPRVVSQPDSNLYLDATVVLGEDWTAPEAPPPTEPDRGILPWWNPRRWVARRVPTQKQAPVGPLTDPGHDG